MKTSDISVHIWLGRDNKIWDLVYPVTSNACYESKPAIKKWKDNIMIVVQ